MNADTKLHDSIKDAREQLNLVLGFFPRVDSKASVVLAINSGMLAVLPRMPPLGRRYQSGRSLQLHLTLLMIAGSFWFLYKVSFPILSGGQQSVNLLSGNREQNRSEIHRRVCGSGRKSKVTGCPRSGMAKLRNPKDEIRRSAVAFVLMAASLVPWVVLVFLFSANSATVRSLFVR